VIVRKLTLIFVLGLLVLAFPASASAHNRGVVETPSRDCVQLGSLKSIALPNGTWLDLRPETAYPQDEYGASYAADEGNSAVEKGQCVDIPGNRGD
jgi:hypothetical protein